MPSAVIFSLCGVRLGMEVGHVREVLPAAKLVQPPEIPAVLRGFLNRRQELVPVLRLETLLQLELRDPGWAPEKRLQSRLVVAGIGEMRVAWLVDEGVEVRRYETENTVRLPRDHVLNNCADRVIPCPAPEVSIVLLDPAKLLLEGEKVRVRQMILREQARQAAFETAAAAVEVGA